VSNNDVVCHTSPRPHRYAKPVIVLLISLNQLTVRYNWFHEGSIIKDVT
jgi:hypothetical protein